MVKAILKGIVDCELKRISLYIQLRLDFPVCYRGNMRFLHQWWNLFLFVHEILSPLSDMFALFIDSEQ